MCCMRDTYRYCIIHMTYANTLDWLDAQKPRPRPRLLLGLAQTEPFHRSHALLPFKNGLSRTGGLSLSLSFYVQVPKLRSKLSVLAMLNHVRSVWKFENQEISQRLASQSLETPMRRLQKSPSPTLVEAKQPAGRSSKNWPRPAATNQMLSQVASHQFQQSFAALSQTRRTCKSLAFWAWRCTPHPVTWNRRFQTADAVKQWDLCSIWRPDVWHHEHPPATICSLRLPRRWSIRAKLFPKVLAKPHCALGPQRPNAGSSRWRHRWQGSDQRPVETKKSKRSVRYTKVPGYQEWKYICLPIIAGGFEGV